MAKLGDIIIQIRGVSYSPQDLYDTLTENSIPLLRANNIQNGNIVLDDVVYVSKAKVSEKQYLKSGDILICTSSGSKELVGKAAFIENDMIVTFGAFCKVIRPVREYQKYIGYFFQSSYYKRKISELSAGANINNIRNEHIENLEIPLPKIEEQHRIAAILDKVTDLINKRRAQLDKLDLLVKSRFVEMFGEPIANPMQWSVKPLKELSSLITNGNTPKGGSRNYVDDGIIFLRSQNVWRNQIILDDVAHINEKTHKELQKSSLHNKDILITKTGRINTENSSLGRAALFLGKNDSANINGHVYLVRLKDTIVPEYVVTILTGEAYRKYIRKVSVGGIDKRQINIDQVENFPIILPPVDMQNDFAVFRNHIFKVKEVVQRSLCKLEIMKKLLVQQYFV